MSPLESQPLDVVLYTFDVFGILLRGVRIVKAQVALATILLCQPKIDGNGLGVADVQVAVRLGWEASLQATAVLASGQVINHHLLNKTHRLLLFVLVHCFLYHDLSIQFEAAKILQKPENAKGMLANNFGICDLVTCSTYTFISSTSISTASSTSSSMFSDALDASGSVAARSLRWRFLSLRMSI